MVADVTLTALVGPISEEFMFRGLLLGGLLASATRAGRTRPSTPAAAAAILASAAGFAAVHGLFDPNSWRAVPAITVGGAVYGVIAVRDGHIMRAVALHALTNGFAVAVTTAAAG